jgi:hypothetical protein
MGRGALHGLDARAGLDMDVNRRRISGFARLGAAIALVSLGCQDTSGLEQTETVRGPIVGTPASILAEATRSDNRWSLPSGFAFKTDTGESISVVARNYEFDGEYLAVDGIARESESSSFILKGDGRSLYGSLVLPERDLAFEYTTSAGGKVIVQRVPIKKIHPVCNDRSAEASDAPFEPSLAALAGEPPHVGDYDGSDTNKLQSRPGATKVLFMDVSVLTLPKADLWRAWQIVSGAYSAFEVNVTTDAAVYEAAEARNRGKACISDEDGRSTCVVNAFGTSRCCTVFNKGSGYYQGNTTAHELGHLMGLDHDGTSSDEYFDGFSSSKWVPMMGDCTPKTSWGAQALFQWSKGEYSGANNTEDDLAIITKNLPYREDDIPSSKALVVGNAGQVSSVDNRGQIARNTDSDTFTFSIGTGGGRAVLVIDRIEVIGGGYLDVDAEIQDAGGARLAQSNDKAARTAKFDIALPAGEYRLIIKGGAEGTPQNGFSNYSSLGFYGISGTITGGIVDGTGGRGGAGGSAGSGGGGGTGGATGSAGRGGSGGAGGGGRGGTTGYAGTTGTAGGMGTGGQGGVAGHAGTGGGAGAGSIGGQGGGGSGGTGPGGIGGSLGPAVDAGAGAGGATGGGGSTGGGAVSDAAIPPTPIDATTGTRAGLVEGSCACGAAGTGRSNAIPGLVMGLLGLGCCRRRARRAARNCAHAALAAGRARPAPPAQTDL